MHRIFLRTLLCAAAILLAATSAFADGPGELEIDEDSYFVAEDAGTLTILIERSRGEDGAVSVGWQTLAGTATDGSDYVGASGTVSWTDGDEGDKPITLTILDDAEAEGAETFRVELFGPTGGAILGEDFLSTITIGASDGGTGGGGGGDSPDDDSPDDSPDDDSPDDDSPDDDSPDDDSPDDDGDDDDGDDDDNRPGTLKFDEDSIEIFEEAGMALVVVERSRGETGAVSVSYMSFAGTATAGVDYQDVSGTLEWADGDESNKTFMVPIVDDSLEEPGETIGLELFDPTGGAILDAERFESTIIILASDGGTGGPGDDNGGDDNGDDDDNRPGTLKFDESSFEVVESIGVAIITVERSRGETGEVSVDYSTADGTAAAGQDYEAVSGTLTWFSGDGTAKTFTVPIVDDTLPEGGETIQLTLSNATGGASIDPERGTSILRILSNDGGTGGDGGGGGATPGALKFDESSFEVLEEAGVAVISVERSGGEDGVVSVSYETTAGSAVEGVDYEAVSGTLTWAAGDGATKTFVVPILDDDLAEPAETIGLELFAPTGGAVLEPPRDSAILTILGSDSATSGGSAASGAGTGTALGLLGGRFRIVIDWQDFDGNSGPGRAVALSDQTGLFWFFDATNFEVLVKMVDACGFSGTRWLFISSTTNVEMTIRVIDQVTGQTETYANPLGQRAEPVIDLAAFGC